MTNSERPYWSNKTPEADRIEQLKRELAEEKAARERAEKLLEGANKSRKSLTYMLRKVRSAKKQRIEQIEAENERLLGLLKVATCPACDGSGAIPHGPLPDGSWEAEQCQWCDERKQALAQPQEEDV